MYGRRASLRQYVSSLQIDPKRAITSMRRVATTLCSNGFVLSRDRSRSFDDVAIAPDATMRVSCIATSVHTIYFHNLCHTGGIDPNEGPLLHNLVYICTLSAPISGIH